MIKQIVIHVRLQSRRLLFAGTLAYLAGFLLYSHIPGSVGQVPVPVLAATMYAMATMGAALLTTWLFPRARRMIDAFAVVRVMFGLWVVALPSVGQPMVASPLTSATVVVGGAIVLLVLGRSIAPLCMGDAIPAEVQATARSIRNLADWLDHTDAPEHLRAADARGGYSGSDC